MLSVDDLAGRRRALTVILLVGVMFLGISSIAGQVVTYVAVRDSNNTVEALQAKSDRDECYRRISIELEQEWRRGVTRMLNAPNRAAARAISSELLRQRTATDIASKGGTIEGVRFEPCPPGP